MANPEYRQNLEEFLASCQRNVQDIEKFIEEAKDPKLLARARKYLKQGLKTVRAVDRKVNKPKSGPTKRTGKARKGKDGS